MAKVRRLLIFLVLWTVCGILHAQQLDDAWREMLELWAEHNGEESVPDAFVETLQLFAEEPINLNDTASDDLLLLPFITDFQRDIIRAYILQNGQMTSLSELHLLNGFDSVTLRLMMPFVTVAPVSDGKALSLADMLRRGHSNMLVGAKSAFPVAAGYDDGTYLGSPLRLYFRYYFKYSDRIVLQLSGDKDAGEPFLSPYNPYGFDYYSYHLMLNSFGVLKRAIVGKYQLQFGQGVTLWSGSAPWMAGMSSLWRYGQGIRPASAFCEYGYLRGAAATVALLPSLDLTLFFSDVDRDGTGINVDSTDDETRYFSLYESGYHRSESELAKKGQLGERLFGGHLGYRCGSFSAGITAFKTIYDDMVSPRSYVYNAFAFRGNENFNIGTDVTYRYRRLLLFGEVGAAINDSLPLLRQGNSWLPVAAVAGMQLHLNPQNCFSVAWHYGSPLYQNSFSNTVGQSSTPQNDAGVVMSIMSLLPWQITLQSSVDLFRHPWMRYRVYSPSTGADYRVKVSKGIAPHTSLSAYYRYHSDLRNNDGALYFVEQTVRRQLRVDVDFTPNERLRLLSRVVYSWFCCEFHDPSQGFVISQDVSYKFDFKRHPLSATLRFAMFDVSGYDARVFLYENDLVYEYTVPSFTGRGLRTYLVVRQQLNSNISLSLKYGATLYPECQQIGTGHDLVEGDIKHEVKVQMRLKF